MDYMWGGMVVEIAESNKLGGYVYGTRKMNGKVVISTYTTPSADPIAILIRRSQSRRHSAECCP
jgi:hypothetical protein